MGDGFAVPADGFVPRSFAKRRIPESHPCDSGSRIDLQQSSIEPLGRFDLADVEGGPCQRHDCRIQFAGKRFRCLAGQQPARRGEQRNAHDADRAPRSRAGTGVADMRAAMRRTTHAPMQRLRMRDATAARSPRESASADSPGCERRRPPGSKTSIWSMEDATAARSPREFAARILPAASVADCQATRRAFCSMRGATPVLGFHVGGHAPADLAVDSSRTRPPRGAADGYALTPTCAATELVYDRVHRSTGASALRRGMASTSDTSDDGCVTSAWRGVAAARVVGGRARRPVGGLPARCRRFR